MITNNIVVGDIIIEIFQITSACISFASSAYAENVIYGVNLTNVDADRAASIKQEQDSDLLLF